MQVKQNVKKVIEKIMKFDQKITVPDGNTINLIEFYQEGRDDIKLSIGSNFKKVLAEATENGKYVVVDISGEVSRISKSVNEFITMNDAGRLEMRKRLAKLAYLMQLQTKEEQEFLQNTRCRIGINMGYLLLPFGLVWLVCADCDGDVWSCDAYNPDDRNWIVV